MAGTKTLVAIDLDGDRLVAVCAAVGSDRVIVRSWLTAARPESVAAGDAEAVGAWIGRELGRVGLERSRVVLAVSRGDVVLKRLVLPRGPSTTEQDIAGMAKLQMARQLTMALDGTAIDYALLSDLEDERGAGEPGVEGGGVAVLAGAMPGERLEWYRKLAAAAGVRLERVGLKAAGVAALLAGASQRRNGPVLGIAPGAGSTEFVIVQDGSLVFARAVDVARPTDFAEAGAYAERIAVEAKRSWMSYRVSRESADVEAVAVVSEGELTRLVGQTCGQTLEMPAEFVGLPRVVQLPADMPEADRSVAAPLIGLLAERVIGRATLDFAHPRRAPDPRARRRQRVLAGALALIVVCGGAYVWSVVELDGLRSRVRQAASQAAELRKERDLLLRDEARLRHLEAWRSARADWLSFVSHLSDVMPDPSLGQVDSVSGRLSATVEAALKEGGSLSDAEWNARQVAVFRVEGRVSERQVANDLRGRLIEAGIFDVGTTGPDMPDRFNFELATTWPSPQTPPPGRRGRNATGGSAGDAGGGAGSAREGSP